jgi:hypothetical protein
MVRGEKKNIYRDIGFYWANWANWADRIVSPCGKNRRKNFASASLPW